MTKIYINIIFWLLLLSSVIYSCTKGNESNSNLISNKTNIIPFEEQSVEVFREYHQNGNLKCCGQYKNNVKIGIWKYYNNSGEIISGDIFENGGRNRWHVKFGPDSTAIFEGHFVDDTLNGYAKHYYSNGKVKSEGTYRKNQKNGYWKEYDVNGNILWEGDFYNDNKMGY